MMITQRGDLRVLKQSLMTRKLSTETTIVEEWSYIALVLRELLSMGVAKVRHITLRKPY